MATKKKDLPWLWTSKRGARFGSVVSVSARSRCSSQCGQTTPVGSENQNLPARVHKGAAKVETIHSLVQQPIEHHFPVARANCYPEFEAGSIVRVVVSADREQVDHFHVEGHGRAYGDRWQLVGHLFPVHKHGAYETDSTWVCGRSIFQCCVWLVSLAQLRAEQTTKMEDLSLTIDN